MKIITRNLFRNSYQVTAQVDDSNLTEDMTREEAFEMLADGIDDLYRSGEEFKHVIVTRWPLYLKEK